jgi:hypothetical protein
MRRAPALAAAALLAGCTVEVDGAPCTAPGSTHECPGGQACGNNRRCSARALACAASRCTPGAGGDCLADPVGLATGTTHARRCSDADPVCGAWVVDPCAARDLACGTRSGGAACECAPLVGAVLAVRPDGTRPGALPFPTGAASPPGCAFRTLTDALARAAQRRAAVPSEDVVVVAGGAGAGEAISFSVATGERFPLTVGTGITLGSDGPPHEILFDADADETAVIALRPRSALAGFTVRSGDRGRAGAAIELACGGADPALVTSVIVDAGAGRSPFAHGVRGQEACSATLRRVEVRNAAAAGILWNPGVSAATLDVSGSSVTGCGSGIEVRSGVLDANYDRIADNLGRGVDATSPGGSPRVLIGRTRIVGNGDTGVAATAASYIGLGSCTVFANRASTRWNGGSILPRAERRAGGIVLGAPPSGGFAMGANRVYANEGDQILILGSDRADDSWTFDLTQVCIIPAGRSRPAELVANVIGCFDPTPAGTLEARYGGVFEAPYCGIALDGAVAGADYQWWYEPRGLPAVRSLSSGAEFGSPHCADDYLPPIASCSSEEPPPDLPYVY